MRQRGAGRRRKDGRGVAPWRSGLLEWLRKPGEPTPEERSAHEGTHLPFRDWCPHCVSCRASDPAHRLIERVEGEPSMVQIDHQFPLEQTNMEISAEQVVHMLGRWSPSSWKPSMEGAQSLYAVVEGRYRLPGRVLHGSVCGQGSRIRSFCQRHRHSVKECRFGRVTDVCNRHGARECRTILRRKSWLSNVCFWSRLKLMLMARNMLSVAQHRCFASASFQRNT